MIRSSMLPVLLFGLVLACDDRAPSGVGPVRDAGTGDATPFDPDAGDGGGSGPDGGSADGMDGGAADMGQDPDPFNSDNDRRDSDCDGLSDQEEFARIFANGQRTAPDNPDSDGDGIPDGVELGRTAAVEGSGCPPLPDADPSTTTSPVVADTDGDGILDGTEDLDRNGRRDAGELDPRSVDTDGDGLEDQVEDANQNGVRDPGELDGTNHDTDGDGIADGVEDSSGDGVFDDGETDPRSNDTDMDGLLDGEEDANLNGRREAFETDPRSVDTDCDGLSDFAELMAGTSPLRTDSDGDGLSDGLEQGITASIPGSDCPAGVPVDADPSTVTSTSEADTDGDGLTDGEEDANGNGRVDPGESDPNDPDTDGDGLDDGDEVLAGFDPTDPADPEADRIPAILQICADANLKVVDFDEDQTWTLSTETSFAVQPVTVLVTGSSVAVSALDDATDEIAGFVMRMPLLGAAAASASAQAAAVDARVGAGVAAEGLIRAPRVSGRNITSHDGFETVVSAIYEVDVDSGTQTPAELRNAMVRLITNFEAADFTGLPSTAGTGQSSFIYAQQLLLRAEEIIIVGAVLDATAFDDRSDNRAIAINDLVNGTALAEFGALRGKDCDPFLAEDSSVADFIWMADISGSTNDDRGRIVNAANLIINELTSNNVDYRMAVVPHSENDFKFPGNGGDFRGVGFTDNPTLFAQYLQDTSGSDGCEFGLEAVSNAIEGALPRTAPGVTDPLKLRDEAALAVVYISDEFAEEITDDGGRCFGYEPACATGIEDVFTTNDNSVCEAVPDSSEQACIDSIVQPYVDQIIANNGTAFAQIIVPQASPTSCTGYRCSGSNQRNEPGRGYQEVVDSTGGAIYSPCVSNPGPALQSIIDAVAGAASQYQLTGDPISSTLRVGVLRIGPGGMGGVDVVPRDRDDGFDYDAASNSIFFRGFSFRPDPGDVVVISYRNWAPVESPCGPCAINQTCDEALGVCVCNPAVCSLCGPNQVCSDDCSCACTLDCNGNCGPGEVCDPTTCECACDDDCGGACGPGTVCNAETCACECVDCGGACAGSLAECNSASCTCECPADCGGSCGGNTSCNESLCECVCPVGCSDSCTGNAFCDPEADCACVCPDDCGGCEGSATCNEAACACECPVGCDDACSNNEVCDPSAGCACACPADCGGCGPAETCDPNSCRCIPVV